NRRYDTFVRREVSRRLPKDLRAKFDPEDVAQEVWSDFFLGCLPNETFAAPQHLRAFLGGMVRIRVLRLIRQWHTCTKRDARREKSLDAETSGQQSEIVDPGQPSPADVAIAKDEHAHLLERLTPQGRSIVALLCQKGLNHMEIAEILGLNE